MLEADLIRLYPRLFHMAEDGSWPSIERHGLLSTKTLLERWEVAPDVATALGGEIRCESSVVEHPEFGRAVVRDQKPINTTALADALVDMSVGEWLDALNSRVFFFLQPERLSGLLNARSYRKTAHTVITIYTAGLVRAHGSRVELCKINSGFAQPHSKAARGRETFQTIADYAHPDREAPRSRPAWDVSELCVGGGVPDIREYVINVERIQADVVLEQIA
jgi:hypothetical protein